MAFPIATMLAVALTVESAGGIEGARFGTVFQQHGTDSVCVSLPGPQLRLPKRLVATYFDPPIALEITATAERAEPCSPDNDPPGISYEGRYVTKRGEERVGLGIVVTGGPYRVLSPGAEPSVRLQPADGDVLRLQRCASTEGLHLTAWLGSRRIWHEYYYLGYDVESTCTDEEWRD